ncbi:PRKCA-binding protein isoform X2 [Lutzomyia longipalpis]|uniref:PRKCA-binding protein isoform X2 n=1 Tax=Lutzomyia longipalpis TaxID=7200 RepID=UPI002483E3B1|nr:PRKCA-binding protein isoform X2 [Lutzomyia longipalpis]
MLDEYQDDYFLEEDKISNTTPQDPSVAPPPESANVLPESVIVDLVGCPMLSADQSNAILQNREIQRLGMTVTSGTVVIKKDSSNLIGISIGGGGPLCPCLYIVQVFDGTPACREGTLQSGDELLGVNGQSVKGKTKVEVAKMIQGAADEVTIHYNKLHADPAQGESLDIILKKVKHRLVEGMSSSTADTLGLSRAILCNDSLVKRLQELQGTEAMYRGLVEHAKRMLKAHFDLLQTYQQFGCVFAAISVREPQARASEAFRLFGEMHRNMERDGVKMLKTLKPVLADVGTYLHKAIPDTKLTIRRYADAKFTYLSYCLKVKEMDDEEHSYAALQEPLYRVETGNYEYRLILRCRQEARARFARLRSDVLEKMELLESKHARDLTGQLKRFIEGLAILAQDTTERLQAHANLFPVEVDLKPSAFQYKSPTIESPPEDDDVTEAAENPNLDSMILNLDTLESPTEESRDLLMELGLNDIDLSQNMSDGTQLASLLEKNSVDDLLAPDLIN